MSLLYNKIIESVKTAIYESLFDDIDDIVTDNDNASIQKGHLFEQFLVKCICASLNI